MMVVTIDKAGIGKEVGQMGFEQEASGVTEITEVAGARAWTGGNGSSCDWWVCVSYGLTVIYWLFVWATVWL